jgi:predicted dehydrogenase
MKQIKLAIIGQGRSGRDIHGAYLKNDKRYKIVAIADFLEERRKRAMEEYGCAVAYEDYHDLFKHRDLDLIVNASYSHMHAPISLEIMKAGFNVLCEKPLAAKAKQVDQLIETSKKSKKMLAIYQNSRYAPYFVQTQKVIKSGVLGRIVQISIAFNGFSRRWDWQTMQERNGGNQANTGPHPIDQALQFFGEGTPKVTCFMDHTDNSFGDAEDHAKIILSGEGHPTIDIEISSCCAYPCFTYNVYGTRGGLKSLKGALEWRYYKRSEAPKQKLIKTPLFKPDRTPAYPQETLIWHSGAWPTLDEKKDNQAGYTPATAVQGGLTQSFYNMLYKTMAKGAALEITPEQVRRQIVVLEECRRQNPQIYKRK